MNNLVIQSGSNKKIRFVPKQQNLDLFTATITLNIAKYGTKTPIVTKNKSNGISIVNGTILVELYPTDTQTLSKGTYEMQLSITSGTNTEKSEKITFYIEESIV
ncbi:MAG: hypothetical protein ACRDD7_03560 [Peptostreptococcaceae bacterium]